MSCRDCVFKGIYQDMGASTDVCNLRSDLVSAVKACENSAECRHRFTVGEAKKFVIEREGELPTFLQKKMVIPQKKTEPKTLNDAFKEVAEATMKAVKAIIESFQSQDTESEEEE